MADENAPPAAEPELDFSDLKKKKKKKAVAFDPLCVDQLHVRGRRD